jgi:hypothetical protein
MTYRINDELPLNQWAMTAEGDWVFATHIALARHEVSTWFEIYNYGTSYKVCDENGDDYSTVFATIDAAKRYVELKQGRVEPARLFHGIIPAHRGTIGDTLAQSMSQQLKDDLFAIDCRERLAGELAASIEREAELVKLLVKQEKASMYWERSSQVNHEDKVNLYNDKQHLKTKNARLLKKVAELTRIADARTDLAALRLDTIRGLNERADCLDAVVHALLEG